MYDTITAVHYSAYRPPLHAAILARVLEPTQTRTTGVDVGCGTGHSARELAGYCHYVIALEPSEAMLDKAENHDKVTFVNAAGEQMPLTDCSADIVTLAGSLNYIERKTLTNELIRICRRDAEILVYDFALDLDEFENLLGIAPADSSPDYDHAANLHTQTGLRVISCLTDEILIQVNPIELAHLLLSDRNCHDALSSKTGVVHPFEQIVRQLRSIANLFPVRSRIYYSVYTLA